METVQPFMLVDGDREAMEFQMIPGTYDATPLTGDSVYVEGDLVELASVGGVGKVAKRTATLTATTELYLAGANYLQPFAKQYLLDAGVPLNVIPSRNQFVMTIKGATPANDYTMLAADKLAVTQRGRRDVVWDATNKCLVVGSTTAAPRCTLLGIFKGDVGDTNVQVIVRLDSAAGA